LATDVQPVLVESFAGGTSGTTVTATAASGYQSLGTADGVLFDVVSIGASTTITYDNTVAHSGTLSCKITTSAASTVYGLWQNGAVLTAATQQWFRLYLYFTANPSSQHQVFGFFVGGTRSADVAITTSGTLIMRNTAGTTLVTTTSTVALNQWIRIEGFVISSATVGQVELKLFNSPDSATPTETQTSAATQNTTGGALTQCRYGMVSGGINGQTWWMDDVAMSTTGYVGPGAVVQQMACGAPTPSGFTVISKPVGGTSVRLKVATDAGLTQNVFFVAAQAPDQYGYVKHAVTGVNPFTRYYCQLADTPAGGAEMPVGQVGTIKTLATPGTAQSFTFAFASCLNTAVENPTPDIAIADWIAYQADLNIFLGDYDYEDPHYTDQPSQIGTWEYQTWFFGTEPMIRQAWGYYGRSNHDSTTSAGGVNDDSNNTWTAANLLAAQEIFPQGTLGDTVNNPVHSLCRTWVTGRVRFIQLDIRNIDRSPGTATDNASKTMLGATQLAWLQAQLVQPEPLKIIATDTQWLGSVVPSLGSDNELGKWWSYQTERAAIVSYMAANAAQVQNVILIHGDFHGVATCTAANNPTGGFPVYCAAPMRQTGASTINPSTFSQYYNNAGGECRQYGRVAVTDSGQHITVNYTGWDALSSVARITQTDVFSTPSLLPTVPGPPNAVVKIQPGMNVQAVCAVTPPSGAVLTTAAGGRGNVSVNVQPGMAVKAVVLVDHTGKFTTS
jgi:hypothetical protein